MAGHIKGCFLLTEGCRRKRAFVSIYRKVIRMKRIKRRIFSGPVCEQIVYNVGDNTVKIKESQPRVRFANEEEREKHRTEISRRRHYRNFMANFGPTSIYSTLTFDNEHEVHEFEEARRLRDNYVARLKRACPNAVIFIYMGRGRSTHRIHFHMVSEGVPEDIISGKWNDGKIIAMDHLREHNFFEGQDHGRDYWALANYLFDHWTPEQGGHRWKQTKNARKPEAETPTEAKVTYTTEKPPRPPKGYMLVDSMQTPYGYLYFRYVLIPPKYSRSRKKKSELV